MAGGFKAGVLFQFSVNKPSYGVNGNVYPRGRLGFTPKPVMGVKSDVLKGLPLYEMGVNIW